MNLQWVYICVNCGAKMTLPYPLEDGQVHYRQWECSHCLDNEGRNGKMNEVGIADGDCFVLPIWDEEVVSA